MHSAADKKINMASYESHVLSAANGSKKRKPSGLIYSFRIKKRDDGKMSLLRQGRLECLEISLLYVFTAGSANPNVWRFADSSLMSLCA